MSWNRSAPRSRPMLESLEDRLVLWTACGGTWATVGGQIPLTYNYSNLFNGGIVGISSHTALQAVEETLSLWSRYVPFVFTEVTTGGNILFGHQDLQGGVIGQATCPRGGRVWWDSSARTYTSRLFLEVGAHEVGHLLGLGHSTLSSPRVDDPGAAGPPIMNPSIRNVYRSLGQAFLFQDDVTGMRARYRTGAGDVITTRNWTFAGDGDWDTDAGWTRGFEPTINANVTIANNRTVSITGGIRGTRQITLGGTASQAGTLQIDAGSLTVRGPILDGIGTSILSQRGGVLNLAGNTVNVDQFFYHGGTLGDATNVFTVNQRLDLGAVTLDLPALVLRGDLFVDAGAPGASWLAGYANLDGGARTFTVSDSNELGSDLIVQAVVDNGELLKAGSGTLRLESASTYTGQTLVSEGQLFLLGSIASSSLTMVAAGASLRGSGIAGPTWVDGTLLPGEGVGIFSVAGDYVQGETGSLEIDLGGLEPGTEYDQVSVSGSAILAGGLAPRLLKGFELTAGATFDVLRAGTIDAGGLFLTGDLAGLFSMEVIDEGGSQVLRLTVLGGNGPAPRGTGEAWRDILPERAPEPGTLGALPGFTSGFLGENDPNESATNHNTGEGCSCALCMAAGLAGDEGLAAVVSVLQETPGRIVTPMAVEASGRSAVARRLSQPLEQATTLAQGNLATAGDLSAFSHAAGEQAGEDPAPWSEASRFDVLS